MERDYEHSRRDYPTRDERTGRRTLVDDARARTERFDRDPRYSRSFASGAEPYPGEAQSQSTYVHGEHRRGDARDFGRGSPESGGYDPYRGHGQRYASGYGGYGESPGEAAGGFDSGRNYAAEPGWGPGYGGNGESSSRGYPSDAPFGRQGVDDSRRAASAELPRAASQSGRASRRPWRGPKGYRRSDERLHEDICERLMWRGDEIDASEVSVEVKDGIVTLSGAVPERSMKHAIEDIVDDCMGVRDIDNRIRVTYGEHREVHAEHQSAPSAAPVSIGGSGASPVSGLGDGAATGGSTNGTRG